MEQQLFLSLRCAAALVAEPATIKRAAMVPVAGDPANTNAPVYATFKGVATVDNSYRDPERIGQRVDTVLDKAGNRANNAALGRDAATQIVTYNTIHGRAALWKALSNG